MIAMNLKFIHRETCDRVTAIYHEILIYLILPHKL